MHGEGELVQSLSSLGTRLPSAFMYVTLGLSELHRTLRGTLRHYHNQLRVVREPGDN